MKNLAIVKSQPIIMVEIIEYEPHTIVTKTIINKNNGIISLLSFDDGEGLTERSIPYDSYAQIIEGRAEIQINSVSFILETGSSIVIPSHTLHVIKANERFKMILTIVRDLR